MAGTATPGRQSYSASELSALARRHLWMHFTRLGDRERWSVPVIVSGDGCYVYDADGKRYLDGLSALFCVNAGHGRPELAEAAAAQMRELAFYTNWSCAHPRAIELAERVAELAPGDLNRVFFTSGGSEAVESALKLARAYHRLTGHARKTKVIARQLAYHGTTLGALSATGLTDVRVPFEPLAPGGCHVANTNSYRWPEARDPLWAADAIAERIEFEGPETVGAVILEPVQNAGGCVTPQDGYFRRVREICDEHDVLLISDEVICSWGRIGHMFGSERYGYVPDIITTAKGLTSAYVPMGAMIASDRVAEPFLTATRRSPTASPSVAIRSPPRSRSRTSTSSNARTSVATSAAARASSGRCSRACATSRSSATSAAPASSARSSWSRTATPRRPFVAMSPSTSCAASSPARSSSTG